MGCLKLLKAMMVSGIMMRRNKRMRRVRVLFKFGDFFFLGMCFPCFYCLGILCPYFGMICQVEEDYVKDEKDEGKVGVCLTEGGLFW